MNKLLSLASALVFASIITTASPALADLKVGTVDMNKIFQSYWKTKDAEAKINEQKTSAQGEFNTRMDGYRKTLEEIQNLNKDLESKAISQGAKDEKSKKRDEKIQDSQQQQRELQSFQQTRERQIQEQIMRERNKIVEDIMKLVQDRVKSDNYDLVFDKSGASSSMVPVVLFSKDSYEFSEDIIKILNKNKPADAKAGATPAPAAPPVKK